MRSVIFILVISLLSSCFLGKQSDKNHDKSRLNTSEILISSDDSNIFYEITAKINEEIGPSFSPDTYILPVARLFVGTPYVSSTLEINEEEKLVVNLREMDCTTFVEYVLAISLCVSEGSNDIDIFLDYLKKIRYRDGKLDAYLSRLHYFTDWLLNNRDMSFLYLPGNIEGSENIQSDINFMSSNPNLYPQLKKHPEYISELKKIENMLSRIPLYHIPKNKIAEFSHIIKDGDIIAFTSEIRGLDFSHTGFACFENNELFLLHASSLSRKVELSTLPLKDYIYKMDNVSGILLARVKLQ